MFISVIFVTHRDRIQMVKRLLASLDEYRGDHWLEIVCVDNGSKPSATAFIEKEYPHVRRIRNEENVGTSRAFNAGIRAASGKYVLVLNDDTIIPDGMLRKIRDFLDGNEGVDGVALGLKNGDGSYQNLRLKILMLGKHSPLEPTRATFVGTGNLLIRKAVIEKIGMFDENYFAGNEDMDLSYRLKKAGGRLVYRPELFVHHLHIYRDRKSGWLDFLVARRLSDLYFTKKFFPLLLGLERLYAYRNIMKRTGNTVDTFTAMKIKALFRLKTDSNYDIQRSLVSRGLHRTHELFIEGKTVTPVDPALASPAARGGGAAARSVRDSVLEKHSIRRALEGYRPIERLVFDFHLTDKTVHEISFNLGINERIVESMISKFMPAVASRTGREEYAPA